jgi:hypothetical protein
MPFDSTMTLAPRSSSSPTSGLDAWHVIGAGLSHEAGPTAATFPSPNHLSSWVGACAGEEESAGVSYSHRSPKGNRVTTV